MWKRRGKEKVRAFLRDSGKLYVLARYFNNIDDPDMINLVKGYYEESNAYTSLLMVRYGEKYPETIVYSIRMAIPIRKAIKHFTGLGAMLRRSLEMLAFAEFLGGNNIAPVIEWGNLCAYYDEAMDSVTKNVFEYYFLPISKVDYRDVDKCSNVIKACTGHGSFVMEHASSFAESYGVGQSEIEMLGRIFRKYIHLNLQTDAFIKAGLKKSLNDKRTLGVHIRGTDFKQGNKYHPKIVTDKEYLVNVKQIFLNGKYDQIFLATDDIGALELFKTEIGDKLVYYKDVFRTANNVGPHSTPNNRSLHYYRMGLEALRDIYTLANCDALICGLSQISFAAQYVNLALERSFEEIIVLNNGMNV